METDSGNDYAIETRCFISHWVSAITCEFRALLFLDLPRASYRRSRWVFAVNATKGPPPVPSMVQANGCGEKPRHTRND